MSMKLFAPAVVATPLTQEACGFPADAANDAPAPVGDEKPAEVLADAGGETHDGSTLSTSGLNGLGRAAVAATTLPALLACSGGEVMAGASAGLAVSLVVWRGLSGARQRIENLVEKTQYDLALGTFPQFYARRLIARRAEAYLSKSQQAGNSSDAIFFATESLSAFAAIGDGHGMARARARHEQIKADLEQTIETEMPTDALITRLTTKKRWQDLENLLLKESYREGDDCKYLDQLLALQSRRQSFGGENIPALQRLVASRIDRADQLLYSRTGASDAATVLSIVARVQVLADRLLAQYAQHSPAYDQVALDLRGNRCSVDEGAVSLVWATDSTATVREYHRVLHMHSLETSRYEDNEFVAGLFSREHNFWAGKSDQMPSRGVWFPADETAYNLLLRAYDPTDPVDRESLAKIMAGPSRWAVAAMRVAYDTVRTEHPAIHDLAGKIDAGLVQVTGEAHFNPLIFKSLGQIPTAPRACRYVLTQAGSAANPTYELRVHSGNQDADRMDHSRMVLDARFAANKPELVRSLIPRTEVVKIVGAGYVSLDLAQKRLLIDVSSESYPGDELGVYPSGSGANIEVAQQSGRIRVTAVLAEYFFKGLTLTVAAAPASN